jgi:hypothetical protein
VSSTDGSACDSEVFSALGSDGWISSSPQDNLGFSDPFAMAAFSVTAAARQANPLTAAVAAAERPPSDTPSSKSIKQLRRDARMPPWMDHHAQIWPCAQPLLTATHPEMPLRAPAASTINDAHGVANNTIPELDHLVALRRITFENLPPSKPAVHVPRPAPSTWQPSIGAPWELYAGFRFTARLHGKWVKILLSRRNKGLPPKQRRSSLLLSGRELWEEILTWFKTNAADIKGAAQRAADQKANPDAHIPSWRPKAATWIIPELAMVPAARGRTWDLRPYLRANEQAKPATPICELDSSNPDPGPWNGPAFQAWADNAAVPDKEFVQQVTAQGVRVPFSGSRASVLTPNAAGFFEECEFAQQTTRDEIKEGYIDSPVAGPPLWPLKLHGRNVALQYKNKLKKRGTGDLSGPHGGQGTDDLASYSVNAGFDLEEDPAGFPSLDWMGSERFAADCATAKTACLPGEFCILKNDWSGFYRQFRRDPSGWWYQVSMTLPEGASIDMRLIFGDASAPNSAMRGEAVFLWLTRYRLLRNWGFSASHTTWAQDLQDAPWMTPLRRKWVNARLQRFGGVTSAMDQASAMVAIFNLIPLALGGFIGTPPPLPPPLSCLSSGLGVRGIVVYTMTRGSDGRWNTYRYIA